MKQFEAYMGILAGKLNNLPFSDIGVGHTILKSFGDLHFGPEVPLVYKTVQFMF